MTMLGFTQEQLIQLLDHPVAFRDQGVRNRYCAIDSKIRKGALLMLSRDNFSDKLVVKKEASAFAFRDDYFAHRAKPKGSISASYCDHIEAEEVQKLLTECTTVDSGFVSTPKTPSSFSSSDDVIAAVNSE